MKKRKKKKKNQNRGGGEGVFIALARDASEDASVSEVSGHVIIKRRD